mgnify:CR=1 FL=1
MPLTKTGEEVMANMRKQYGERGKEVFYRSINKGVAGSKKWHKMKKKKKKHGSYSPQAVAMARKMRG